MSEKISIKRITLAGLLTAVIFVATAYIHVPTGLGYTHIGDGFIFLAAALLPKKYSIPTAALGAALADAACGMMIWAPATLVIKTLIVLPFAACKGKILVARNYAALITALLFNSIGYSLYEAAFMTSDSLSAALVSAFAQTPFYTIQTAMGAAIFFALGKVLDTNKIRT